MKVTGIEEISKSRSRVFIEEQFAFVLYKGELRSYHISVGQELRQEDYESIWREVLPKRAKLRAMNLLKSREYTVKQLHDKLSSGGYPEEIIADAISYVSDYHYLDDLRYAETYIAGHENSRSRRRIEQDLMRKGIEKETVAKAWLVWAEKGGSQNEQKMIQELLCKRKYNPENTDRKEQQRLYGFLMRKGFSGEQIRRALFLGDTEDCC